MRGTKRAIGLAVAITALGAATAGHAAFPGSNGRVFFDASGGGNGRVIASVKPEGSDRTRVAEGIEPAVSPNGSEIAYARRGDLYLAARGGTDEIQITNTPEVERTPSFSPSGNRLVFATERHQGEDGHIFSMRTDGGDRTRLTQSEQADFSPSYSPSGNKIVFTRELRDATEQLFKMDADGTHIEQLTFARTLSQTPSWSPDGNRIAFQRFDQGDSFIYSIEPDGSDLLQLTSDPGARDFEPAYSPSGNKIVYRGQVSEEDESKALFVIPASGGAREQLTEARQGGVDADPYWGTTP